MVWKFGLALIVGLYLSLLINGIWKPMMSTHLIPPIRLILALVIGCLVSCKSAPKPTWPECDLMQDFTVEQAEGEGFEMAVTALTAHIQTQPLPGTTVIAKEEDDRVTWNIFDGERWIGEIAAVKDPAGLWFVSHGAWCTEE